MSRISCLSQTPLSIMAIPTAGLHHCTTHCIEEATGLEPPPTPVHCTSGFWSLSSFVYSPSRTPFFLGPRAETKTKTHCTLARSKNTSGGRSKWNTLLLVRLQKRSGLFERFAQYERLRGARKKRKKKVSVVQPDEPLMETLGHGLSTPLESSSRYFAVIP